MATELAVGAHFARHTRYFRSEHAQLLNHRVNNIGGPKEFALKRATVDIEPNCLGQVALGHGGDCPGYFSRRPQEIFDQRIDRDFHVIPGAAPVFDPDALPGLAFFSDGQSNSLEFECHLFVGDHDFIEVVGDLPGQPGPRYWQANAEVAFFHGLKALQDGGQALRHRRFQHTDWVTAIPILPADGRINGRRHAGCS